jgi:tetratricopeptide (TPR) repeat protein
MALTLIAQTTHRKKLPIEYFKKAIRLFPQYAITRAQYGAYLKDIGRLPEAIKELKLATKVDPSMVEAYAWLAETYFKNEQRDLGKEAAQKARELGYEKIIVGEKTEK